MINAICFTIFWLISVICIGIWVLKFSLDCFINGEGWEKLLGVHAIFGWGIVVAIPFFAS